MYKVFTLFGDNLAFRCYCNIVDLQTAELSHLDNVALLTGIWIAYLCLIYVIIIYYSKEQCSVHSSKKINSKSRRKKSHVSNKKK